MTMNWVEPTGEQKIIDTLIERYNAIQAAKKALAEAEEKMTSTWEKMLAKYHRMGIDFPLPAEKVVVQDGGWVYQIEFDITDWGVPEIKRVEQYVKIMNRNEWT